MHFKKIGFSVKFFLNLTENRNGGGQFSIANQWGLIARFYSLRDIATDLMVWRGFVFRSVVWRGKLQLMADFAL